MRKEPPFTTKEEFIELMKEVYEGWMDVREYDDEHLYYDRHKSITDGIDNEWWEYPDEYETDIDMTTLSIQIEQYLRFHNIVKETKIGLLPKVDGVSEKLTITEKDLEEDEKKIDTIGKLTNYLLKR
tara:strand:- start:1310 stop:1690 length:381 start_codon:yes stop_codon:yes gene_type:complete